MSPDSYPESQDGAVHGDGSLLYVESGLYVEQGLQRGIKCK